MHQDNLNIEGFEEIKELEKKGSEIFGISSFSHEYGCAEPSRSYDCSISNSSGNTNKWYQWGEEDKYPKVLKNLIRGSHTHSAAITTKANGAFGEGYEFIVPDVFYDRNEDNELIRVDFTEDKEEERLKAEMFAKNISLNKAAKAGFYEMFAYGGYFEISDYGKRKSDFSTYLQRLRNESCENARLSVARKFNSNENEWCSKDMFVSECFENAAYKTVSYKRYQSGLLNFNNTSHVAKIPSYTGTEYDDNFAGNKMRFVGRMTPLRKYYPTPDYESLDTLNYLDVERMISEYDHKGISSGFTAEYLVVMFRAKGKDEEEEVSLRKKDRDAFKSSYTGPKGARQIILWATPVVNTETGKIEHQEPFKLIPIPKRGSIELYKYLAQRTEQVIRSSHGVIDPLIIGQEASTGKGMSNISEYLITTLGMFYKSRIAPMVKLREDADLDYFRAAGIRAIPKIRQTPNVFRIMTENLMLDALTRNETRKEYGFPELKEDQINTIAEEAASRANKNRNEQQQT